MRCMGVNTINWEDSSSKHLCLDSDEEVISPSHESNCPEERSKAKEVENYQNTFALTRERLKLFFRAIISENQLSIYGAVSNLCEECKTCHVRTGRLVLGRTISPIVCAKCDENTKTHPSTNDPAQEEDLLQKYQERVEKLSTSKSCD